jgi:hypothetical protein
MPQIKDLLSILRGETSIVPTGGAVSAPHTLQDAAANEAPSAPADWSAVYMDYLKMEGYEPSLEGNGDIRFKHDN